MKKENAYYMVSKQERGYPMIHKFQEYERQCFTFEQFNVLNNLISLWQRYAMWTRALFLSKSGNSPNLNAVENRYYQIPMDFYNTLRVFYGERLAEQFLNSFQRYILIQSNLMDAMIANDQENVNAFTQQLYASADEIAAFLSQAPYWSFEVWKSLLYQDVSSSIAGFRASLTGEHELEISIFERLLLNAAEIGGYMASGIFQFSQPPVPIQR